MRDLEGLLKECSLRHSHLCPRQVLGVRMGLAGAAALGPILPVTDKSLLVIAETDGLLLALDGQTFLDVVIAGPEMASRFLELYDVSGVRETIQEPASPAVA